MQLEPIRKILKKEKDLKVYIRMLKKYVCFYLDAFLQEVIVIFYVSARFAQLFLSFK